MSIVLVTFPKAPQPSAKVIDEEKQLEKHIEERIKGKCVYLISLSVVGDEMC